MKTNKQHKISVVIPAYNAADTIARSLDSIKAQVLKDLEIVIVDDGSADATNLVVQAYASENPDLDIIYVKQENAGPGVARNTGIENATGEYIAFMDADDTAPEGAYQAMYSVAKKWDSDIVVGAYMRKVNNGSWYVPDYIKRKCEAEEGKNCAGDYRFVIYNPSLWNRLFKREFLNANNIRFTKEFHGEDVVFNLDAVQRAQRIYTTDAITYYYKKEEAARESVSSSWSYRHTSSRIRTTEKYAMFFDSIGDVESECAYLKTVIPYLLEGLKTITNVEERTRLFEESKAILRPYVGAVRYEYFLEMLLGLPLKVVLELPYDAYFMQKSMAYSLRGGNRGGAPYGGGGNGGNHKEIVLRQYKEGKIGFKYILMYIKAWLSYKLKK